jgi:lambda family phage portal protein
MNWIDKILLEVAPSFAAKRFAARGKAKILNDASRSFEAATRTKRGNSLGFGMSDSNPNVDIQTDIALIRNRSRNAYKNNRKAKKAIRVVSLNTIGKGIRPAWRGTKSQEKAISSVWKDWAETKACDFEGRKNIYAIQALAFRTLAVSGECFVVRRRDSQSIATFTLQVFEGDYVPIDNIQVNADNDKLNAAAGEYISQGVKFDKDGRRLGYYFRKGNATDWMNQKYEFTFIEEEDVIHLFEQERPGQIRGIPFLATALLKLADADDYEDVELIRKKTAACLSVFITADNDGLLSKDPDSTPDDPIDKLHPGQIGYLRPGQQVNVVTPQSDANYSEYMKNIDRSVSQGVGVSYESYSNDYSNVNFSSGRMGWIEASRQIEDWQYNTFIPDFCEKLMGWLNLGLKARNILSKDISAEWTPQGRVMIDPVKEVKGIVESMANGLKSWSEAIRELGYDPDTVRKQIQDDYEKMKDIGIPLPWLHGTTNINTNKSLDEDADQ